MTRLNLIVEGQTEEAFVNNLLVRHLAEENVYTSVRCVETSRKKGRKYRGGITNYAKAKSDIKLWMKEDSDPELRFSTMFDLYALPGNFPDHELAKKLDDPFEMVAHLENALQRDIGDPRFLPYIQLHEFEALLLVDPLKFAPHFPDKKKEIEKLAETCRTFPSPEHINSHPNQAPSKRIINHIPDYEGLKTTAGPIIAEDIGLTSLRQTCVHFGKWLSQLEKL